MEYNNFSLLVPNMNKGLRRHEISHIPIFGTYKLPEDQLTIALLHVIKVGGETLLQEIVGLAGKDLMISEMLVTAQVPFVSHDPDSEKNERGCRADGYIYKECGYNLYLEIKIRPTSINDEQLDSYRKISTECSPKLILYVTPDEERPEQLNQDEAWVNWDVLLEFLKNYVSDEPEQSLLRVYVHNLIMLYDIAVRPKLNKQTKKHKRISDEEYEQQLSVLANKNIVRTADPLNPDDDVIIVGGQWGEPIALKYGFYACQYGRTFLPAQYLAFYHRNRIKYLFRIIGTPCNVDSLEVLDISTEYFENEDKNYVNCSDEQKRRKYFKLQLIHIFDAPIKNDTISATGRRVAYTQNQRYTTIERILTAKNTSDL